MRKRITKEFKSHTILKEEIYSCKVLIDGVYKTRYFFCQLYLNNYKGISTAFVKRYWKKKNVYGQVLYLKTGHDSFAVWNDVLDALNKISHNVSPKQDRYVRVLKEWRDEGLIPTDVENNLLPKKYLFSRFKIVTETKEEYHLEIDNKNYTVNKEDFEKINE